MVSWRRSSWNERTIPTTEAKATTVQIIPGRSRPAPELAYRAEAEGEAVDQDHNQ